ncbi:hypothetical protein RRG08_020739 [Elysia crispata]|uniref:Uncharacterized protein n=1 Tax=Elysia crispata TaxID=231223 RepID=A0AAE1AV27_9GAST|nr:hypothetical protein RRG08_020739 [Elysia crispata]
MKYLQVAFWATRLPLVEGVSSQRFGTSTCVVGGRVRHRVPSNQAGGWLNIGQPVGFAKNLQGNLGDSKVTKKISLSFSLHCHTASKFSGQAGVRLGLVANHFRSTQCPSHCDMKPSCGTDSQLWMVHSLGGTSMQVIADGS